MAQTKWDTCLEDFTNNACNVVKDNSEKKKTCEEARTCLQRGYDEPLSSNIWDAFGESVKKTASVATVAVLIGIYAIK